MINVPDLIPLMLSFIDYKHMPLRQSLLMPIFRITQLSRLSDQIFHTYIKKDIYLRYNAVPNISSKYFANKFSISLIIFNSNLPSIIKKNKETSTYLPSIIPSFNSPPTCLQNILNILFTESLFL